jgi:cytidyltransferase-like protein
MQKKERIIITAGEFDPISREDLDFLKRCKKKGDWLVVGLHTDWFMQWARGGSFQSYETRIEILEAIDIIDEIFRFDDTDGTVCQLLKTVKCCYPNSDITYVSEEDMHNMPETKIRGITFEKMK